MSHLTLAITTTGLLALAPVPVLKPIADPDRAIDKFVQSVENVTPSVVEERKARLILRMKQLHETMLKRGAQIEAESVQDRIVLMESFTANKLTQPVLPAKETFKRASCEGKYRHLLHVLYVPNDQKTYGDHRDFGHWPGSSYVNYTDLKHGHWVYAYPRWFVWRDGPPRP